MLARTSHYTQYPVTHHFIVRLHQRSSKFPSSRDAVRYKAQRSDDENMKKPLNGPKCRIYEDEVSIKKKQTRA